MKLNVYLLRDDVTDPEEAIQVRHRDKKFKKIRAKAKLPTGMRGWIQDTTKRRPTWASWLEEGFEIPPSIENRSNGFVLGVEALGRWFMVTFGYGANALDLSKIEPDFGLRAAVNSIEDGRIDTLDTRRLDKVTRQSRLHMNSGQALAEFGIAPTVDWLRSVRGTIKLGSFEGKIQGSDAVQVSWAKPLEKLGMACEELLELYASERYKTNFRFLDYLRPLRKQDPLREELDREVLTALARRDGTELSVAHPELPEQDVHEYRIFVNKAETRVEDVDLAGVFELLDGIDREGGAMPDPSKVHVVALDDAGAERSKMVPLWRYLVAHVKRDDKMYVLSLGEWYRTDADYVALLRDEVRALPDAAPRLLMPSWPVAEKEDAYNRRVAAQKSWLLLDRALFRVGDPQSKFECADLISRGGDLIHVKTMTESATMSHLFSQGTVSSRLQRAVPDVRVEMDRQMTQAFGAPAKERAVVLAIGTTKPGDLADVLFFFSLVNLSLHLQTFRAMSVNVELCKIERL